MGVLKALSRGLGAGLQTYAQTLSNQQIEQQRERAAAALEQRMIAREAAQEQRDIAKEDRTYGRQKELLGASAVIKQRENESTQAFELRKLEEASRLRKGEIAATGEQSRLTEGVKFGNEKEITRLRGRIDMEKDENAADIERGVAKVVGTTPDGFIVLQRGNSLITTNTKSVAKSGGGGLGAGGAIEAARGSATAPAAEPAKPAQPARLSPAPSSRFRQEGGVFIVQTPGDADAFVADPANSGKTFRGPDGQIRRVP